MVESYYNIKNGCSKWHDCYNCCFLDDCHVSQNDLRGTDELREQRNNKLNELFKEGKSTKEAAKEIGISQRQARRIKALTKSS